MKHASEQGRSLRDTESDYIMINKLGLQEHIKILIMFIFHNTVSKHTWQKQIELKGETN